MSYIYKITNDINNKIYVGKTNLSIEKRFKEHIRDSQKKTREQRPLYRAFNKYGINHFKIELIEECHQEEASAKECYWIEQLNSYHNGYNATKGGDGKNLFNHQEILNYLILHPYPIEVAKKFKCSPDLVRQIAEQNNVQIYNISNERFKNISKPITQYTMDDIFIQNFPSFAEAARWLKNQTNTPSSLNSLRAQLTRATKTDNNVVCNYKWKLIKKHTI